MMKLIFHINYYHLLLNFQKLNCVVWYSQEELIIVSISGLDNFVNFQLKMANSYLKKLSM